MSMPLPGSGHDIEEIKRTARVLEAIGASFVAWLLYHGNHLLAAIRGFQGRSH
jgi:hypothetical protein